MLWEDLTIEDHLLFYLRLKGISNSDEKQNVAKAADQVLLKPHLHKKVRELSGGMKRRLSLAISLVGDPKVIFLDEPTTGLDPANRTQFWSILFNVKKGRAILLTTHIMKEADILSDKIAIIDRGVIKAYGMKQDVKRDFCSGYLLSGSISKQSVGDEINQTLAKIEEELEKLKRAGKIERYRLRKQFLCSFCFKVKSSVFGSD